LPRATRFFLGRCAIVFFGRAALAAFLIFRFAAVRCFLVVTEFFEAKVCAASSSAGHEAAYFLAATLSGARRFFRGG